MRIAVFGGTGRIGRQVVPEALSRGHDVVALVRDPARLPLRHERLAVVRGDVRDPDAVRTAVGGADAVISALGPRRNTRRDEEAHVAGMANILRAMRERGVRRLVTVLGAGIDAEGDRKGPVDRLASRVVRRLARHVHAAKRREFDLLLASDDVEWVAARPPIVTGGPGTGRYRADLRRPPGRRIAVGDLARFLLDQLQEDAFVRKAPFVAS